MIVPIDPTPDPASDPPLEMDRHEERLHVSVTRVPYRNVRVHRRIVSEIRRIDVEVRSEVLDIDWEPVYPSPDGETAAGDPASGDAGDRDRIEVILYGEVPQVQLVTVAKERVVINRVTVPGTVDVTAELQSERIAVDTLPPESATS